MKKLFILGAGVVGTMMFMASCSNEEEVENITRSVDTQTEELKNLKMSIVKLNEQWENKQWPMPSRTIANSDHSFGIDIAKKARSIVDTDLAGANFGARFGTRWALAIGAAASAIAFIETFFNSSVTFTPLKMQGTSARLVYAQDGQTPTMMDSIGYYHNLILQKIGAKKLTTANLDSIEQYVVQSMDDIFGKEAQSITAAGLKSNESYKFLKSHISKLNNAINASAFCNILSEYETINQDELDVLKVYMIGLESKDNANGEYTAEVLKTVNSSELDTATKERIRAGIIVGNASQKLWSPSSK